MKGKAVIRGVDEKDAHLKMKNFVNSYQKEWGQQDWHIVQEGYVEVLKFFKKYEIILEKV